MSAINPVPKGTALIAGTLTEDRKYCKNLRNKKNVDRKTSVMKPG
jgi:hypothetical protein